MRVVSLLLLVACLATGQALAGTGGDGHGGGRDVATAWGDAVPAMFSHLGPAEGLPYPVALGLAQDGNGFIWVATPGGVARWDGYHMKVFRHDDADAGSLPEDIVTNALADRQGRVWFGTASGVVLRFDQAMGGFAAYRDRGAGFGRPFAMASDGKGGIWLAGRQGLARLDVASGLWRYQTGLPEGGVGSVLIDHAGCVWAGTGQGIMRKCADDQPFEPIATPALLRHDVASALFEDGSKAVWFGTRRGYVGRIEPGGNTAVIERALPPTGYRITAFIEPRPGTLWIGAYGGGIRELRLGTGSVRRFFHDPTIASSLGDNAITALLIDRSGLIWASSLRGVQRHIPGNQHLMTIVRHGPGGLPGSDVRSVAATTNGKVWLGFRAEGVALLDPTDGIVKAVHPGGRAGELSGTVVQAIADTANGTLWVGQSTGLSQVNVKTGRVTPYGPLAGADIQALRHDGTDLWAGGSLGLARLPLDGSAPRFYRHERDDPNSLSDNSVQAIFRDSDQRLWLGTQRGLNVLEDSQTGKFRRILNDPNDPESLPSDIVNNIAEDRFGRLWLATANGIGIFDPDRGGKARFIRLRAAQGLPSNTVLSVLEGDAGTMIAGTGGGLAVIEPETLAVRSFGPADGMEIRTFWAGSTTRMSDGTVIVGGFGGLAAIRPTSPPGWDYRPPVVATDIRVGGLAASTVGDVVVRPEDGGFQVDFAALDFSAPERNRYAYRLDDGNWVPTDFQHRTAGYTNLSPGRHLLEILGSNSTGIWGRRPLSIHVQVLPDWYQTAWFRLLAAIAVLAAVIGLTRGRKAYHLRREQELTRQVAAKTAEAEAAMLRALAGEEDARQAKERAEAADRMKSRFLAIIGHEIRTPLNGVLGMLQLLRSGTFDGEARTCLGIAQRAGENLRHLVESVLEYGSEGARNPGLVAVDTDIRRLAAEALDLVRAQAEAKGLALGLTVQPAGPVRVRVDRTRLSRILVNLLGNAVKFTDHGAVAMDISVGPVDDRLRLSARVTDTGIGIAPELRDDIFGEFVQADDSITRKFGGVGLGLAISRRMAGQMGGTLTLTSTPGSGSTFSLHIPVEAGPNADVDADAGEIGPSDPAASSLRVLVVDDDDINLRVAERLLRHLGHAPETVTGGEAAVAVLAASEFDVVLMDLRMPVMDGMQATRRIRQQEEGGARRIRVVAMTADLNDDIWRQCLAAGMDGGLSKPVELEKLRRALGGAGADQGAAPPRLDADFLRMQLDILGPVEMVRLTRMFQKISHRIIREMDAAAGIGERSTVEALAHRLRSAAGPLGLVGLADVAARLEAQSATAPMPALQSDIVLLRQARRVGLKALRITLGRGAGSGEMDLLGESIADSGDSGDHAVAVSGAAQLAAESRDH